MEQREIILLEKEIKVIRKKEPLTYQERVEYIKRVKKCFGIISSLYDTNPDYIYKNIDKPFCKIPEYIISVKSYSSASTCKVNKVKAIYGNKCVICDFPIVETLNAHHIIPRHLCGKNDITNLIALCPTCHKIFHIIESEGCINEVLTKYLSENGYLDSVLNYTKHLFNENYL